MNLSRSPTAPALAALNISQASLGFTYVDLPPRSPV
jgi:hypothetical protein